MKCPKCNSNNYVKDGIVKQRQRFRCKQCNYRYTVKKRSSRIPENLKKSAIELYLEGLGFRAIGRVLGVSNVSVMNWVAQYAKQFQSIKSPSKPTVIEMDELHTYIQSKKNIAGSGLLLIDLKNGLSTLLPAAEKPQQAKNSGNK